MQLIVLSVYQTPYMTSLSYVTAIINNIRNNVCVCMCVRVYCVCACVCACVCIVRVHVCVLCRCVCVCVHVCIVRVCMCVLCMSVYCACVCMCVLCVRGFIVGVATRSVGCFTQEIPPLKQLELVSGLHVEQYAIPSQSQVLNPR